MRVLIDECLNWRLGRALAGHYFASVAKLGWSGISNGQLLALAEQNSFDVFLTGDRNLRLQQNTARQRIAIVILEGTGIQLHQTLPLRLCFLRSVLGRAFASDREAGARDLLREFVARILGGRAVFGGDCSTEGLRRPVERR